MNGGVATASTETAPCIRVGTEGITENEVLAEMQYHPAASLEQARHEAARALVVRALLLARAKQLGLLASTAVATEREYQDAIRQVTETEVPVSAISAEACEAFYRENPDRFRGPALYDPSHILFPAATAEPQALALVEKKAQSVLDELLRRPSDFERRARELSACPSGANGGQLGQVTLGETTKPFEQAFLELEEGELCEQLVRTRHGFHILRLNQKAPGATLPLAAVIDKIRIYLRDAGWRKALRDYVLTLTATISVVGFDLEAEAPPVPVVTPSAPSVSKLRRLRVLS